MVVASEDPKQSTMSVPFGNDLGDVQDTQPLELKSIDNGIGGSKGIAPPEGKYLQYDEYTTLLRKHLSVVESELSRLKAPQA